MKRAPCCALRVIRLIEIWCDDAPGERRAALVENGEIVELHIQRDLQIALGERGTGRIVRKTPAGSYLVTASGEEVLLRAPTDEAEGASVTFEIVREAIWEPGRLKHAEVRLIGAAEAMADRDALWAARIGWLDAPRSNVGVSGAFDIAIAGYSNCGAATVFFQRTKAGLVFDVDGTGDPMTVNISAAREIARLLRLYQIGGSVMIDFVDVGSRQARQAVAEAFDAASAGDGRAYERSAVTGFGLMQIIRPRQRPSVLDQLFGARIQSLSDESIALQLLRQAAHSGGFGKRTVRASPAIATLLSSPRWLPLLAQAERLAGAPVEIVADAAAPAYGHVHVAQS
jgi:ribonuclease G